jgi:hypothetical protein
VYESASILAKANYEENQRNAYHIQAYFNTLVNSPQAKDARELFLHLIGELESINSDLSIEMAKIAQAEFYAKCEDDYTRALDIINDTAEQYPDSHYPLLTKAFLAAQHRDLENLRIAYQRLTHMGRERAISDDSLVRLKAYIFALEGDLAGALSHAETNLRRCPENSRHSFMQRLREIAREPGPLL